MMDFKNLIRGTDRYNFHSHTQFCDGRASMEEFAEVVAAEGFVHWGFSPHSPVPIESPCNMSMESVPIYLSEVERLNRIYMSAPIRFYAAMEIDYLGDDWGPSNQFFRNLPLDYRIGSVHFIPSQDGTLIDIDGRFDSFRRKLAEDFHNDLDYVVNTFFDQSIAMVEAGGFDIIGHFDKIGHNGSHMRPGLESQPFYRRRLAELTDAVIASGLTVEINTKAWAEHKRMFPSPSCWSALLKANVPIVVNSDAHHLNMVNAGRSEAFALLNQVSATCSD